MSDNEASNIAKSTIKSVQVNQKALRNVTAKVIEVQKDMAKPGDAPGKSQALGNPLEALMAKGKVIEPPFDLLTLAMLPEHNTEMGQCIEVMETNIEGFGHRFVPRIKPKAGEKLKPKVEEELRKEKVKLENFFTYCTNTIF